ncbi:Ribonuclease R [Azospirillaceae bacterium]
MSQHAPTDKAERVIRKPFPSREAVLEFIRESPAPVGKREIARAFHLYGDDRIALKEMLRQLERDGALERNRGRRVAPPASLPEVSVVVVSGVDVDGEVLARPFHLPEGQTAPVIYMQPEKRGHPALGRGEKVLARLRRLSEGQYEGQTLRRLDDSVSQLVGVFRPTTHGGRVEATERRNRSELSVPAAETGGAEAGDLVLVELLESSRYGLRQARVVDRLGRCDAPNTMSLIAIHAHGLPTTFPSPALAEAERCRPPGLEGRIDLRDLPLVTIDGADARDFDDAVWAEPDSDPANRGGWRLMVAIADVAWYVRPGSVLDRAAFERGNSAYFPDRVVPMLPEALSNGVCSLKPGEERACLAVELWLDRSGTVMRHRFQRGLMRSAARLTYEQAQQAHEGAPDDVTAPLMETVIRPLFGAYEALKAARERRGVLDLDLPERQIHLNSEGLVAGIGVRPHYDSHRLIEEFMISANVAAAETLENHKTPCMYRIHDQPAKEKLENARVFLRGLGYTLDKGQVLRPTLFSRILEQAAERPEAPLIHEMILRCQAQAVYSPNNIGHFGLALIRYAHFTSPIRRYADLIVHRALVRALGFGPDRQDGLDDESAGRLKTIAEHISMTERRAASAERETVDRFCAAYLADRVGAVFQGRVSGVTRFGLFVRLDDVGADGLLPVRALPNDYYEHDEKRHSLIGKKYGGAYRLGMLLRVRLVEADPLAGSILFALGAKESEDSSVSGKKLARQTLPCDNKASVRGGKSTRR